MEKSAVPVFWTEENKEPENIILVAPHVYSGYKEQWALNDQSSSLIFLVQVG